MFVQSVTSVGGNWFSLKPVLNWAKCLFAEDTSDSSTNYDLFFK